MNSKNKLSKTDKLIGHAKSVMDRNNVTEGNHNIINSVISFYKRRGFVTKKQKALLNRIIKTESKRNKKLNKTEKSSTGFKFVLYAISDSKDVKLGISSNLKKRLKTLQTGSSTPLEVLWTLPCGDSRLEAVNNERKLHRACKQYRLVGEWFSLDCMDIVRMFEIRNIDADGNRRKYLTKRGKAEEIHIDIELDDKQLCEIPVNF